MSSSATRRRPFKSRRLAVLMRLIARRSGRSGFVFPIVFLAMVTSVWLLERRAPAANIRSWLDALWFGVVTLSTVGYGDHSPVTGAGRTLVGAFILFTIVMIGYVLTAINEAVLELRQMEDHGVLGTGFTRHVVVIGVSPIARTAITELLAAGHQVAVLCEREADMASVRRLGERASLFVALGDASLDVLRERLHVDDAASIVIAMESDSASIVAALNVRAAATKARVVVSVQAEALRQTLIASGVTYVLSPYELSGRLVASAAFEPDVAQFVEEVTAHAQGGFDLQQFSALPFAGKTVAEVQRELAEIDGPLLIGLAQWKGGAHTVLPNPPRKATVQREDRLLLLTNEAQSQLFEARFGIVHAH